jgi:hypothetical protein
VHSAMASAQRPSQTATPVSTSHKLIGYPVSSASRPGRPCKAHRFRPKAPFLVPYGATVPFRSRAASARLSGTLVGRAVAETARTVRSRTPGYP